MVDQVVVESDPKWAQISVAVRQAVLGLGLFVTGLGASHLGSIIGLSAVFLGPLAGAVVVVMGQMHERHTVATKAMLARMSPEQVTVK